MLSTFILGVVVAVIKRRLSGDQPYVTAASALALPSFFSLCRSHWPVPWARSGEGWCSIAYQASRQSKSIAPARLPNPATHRNRPCGDQAIVLRCASPKLNVGSARALKSVVCAGCLPAHTAKTLPVGAHCASPIGPSLLVDGRHGHYLARQGVKHSIGTSRYCSERDL